MPSSACHGAHRLLHSFPTRRSSDLGVELRHVAVRTAVSPILALLGVAVSTIAPVISLVLFVAIPVVYGATAGRYRKNRRNKRQHSGRSEEHTSELQSHSDLVCRLLLATAPTDFYTLSLHDALPI